MLRNLPDDEIVAMYLKAEQAFIQAMFADDKVAVMAYEVCAKRIREVMWDRGLSVPVG